MNFPSAYHFGLQCLLATAHSEVTLTNLRHRTHGVGEYPKSLTRIKFNGLYRPDIVPTEFKFGQSVHDSFDTGPLLSGAPLLTVETYKKTNSQHLKRLGMLSMPLFVSGDSSRPVITLTNEDDYGYESFAVLPAPVIKIEDSIVGIDKNSISASLYTVLNADGAYTLTVNAKNACGKEANPFIFEFIIDSTPREVAFC